MNTIRFDNLVSLMIDASRQSLSNDKIIGTIKIRDCTGYDIYLYLLYFDSSSFIDPTYSFNDVIYALVFDSLEETVTLDHFTLRFLYDHFISLSDDFNWIPDFIGSAWWIPAYHHYFETESESVIMNFHMTLDTHSRNIFDSTFEKFCHESGYGSIDRNCHYEEILFHMQRHIDSLSDELEKLRNPIATSNEDDLPF